MRGEMVSMFFLQMSGVPGSGKSTLARAISKNTGAIVIDHDIVKSTLLDSQQVDLDSDTAGKISYNIEWALIEFYLSQGQSIIFDSPCLYTEMVEKGTALSKKYGAKYKYVECILNDIREIDNRLRSRQRLKSQNHQVTSEKDFRGRFERSKRPSDVRCLIVDSARPLDSYLDEVISYINE
jgi:predicted kinase